MSRRKPMTAADFLAQQESDPEYVARRLAQQERVQQQEAELKAAEAPLVDDLRAMGIDVEWSWDLVNQHPDPGLHHLWRRPHVHPLRSCVPRPREPRRVGIRAAARPP